MKSSKALGRSNERPPVAAPRRCASTPKPTPRRGQAFFDAYRPTCTSCLRRIEDFETMIGTGDGSGRSFAHARCFRKPK